MHRSEHGSNYTIAQIMCHHPICCQRHVLAYQQWHILLIGIQSTVPMRRLSLSQEPPKQSQQSPCLQGSAPAYQWHHSHAMQHHAQTCLRRCQSRTWWTILQRQRSLPHSDQLSLSQTTAQLLASPTIQSNRKGPKLLTCNFIGPVTESAKANSLSFGKRGKLNKAN
jgi:hypothetical protein